MTATLSGYELSAVLGRGQTGEVWVGRQPASGATIAAKIVCSELADDPRWVARLIEAQSALLGLGHSCIVPILDVVVDSGRVTIVSALVDGRDLRRSITTQRGFTPKRAATIAGSVLSALAAAHAIGIVHGSLRLENVLITADDQVRITDFGVAAPIEVDENAIAADVYFAGVLLHELLTGTTPAYDDEAALVRSGALPDKLWDLTAAMLATDPPIRMSAADARLRLASLIPRLSMLEALAPPVPSPESDEEVVDAAIDVQSERARESREADPALPRPTAVGALEPGRVRSPDEFEPIKPISHRKQPESNRKQKLARPPRAMKPARPPKATKPARPPKAAKPARPPKATKPSVERVALFAGVVLAGRAFGLRMQRLAGTSANRIANVDWRARVNPTLIRLQLARYLQRRRRPASRPQPRIGLRGRLAWIRLAGWDAIFEHRPRRKLIPSSGRYADRRRFVVSWPRTLRWHLQNRRAFAPSSSQPGDGSARWAAGAPQSWLRRRLAVQPSATRTTRMAIIGVVAIVIVAIVAAIARLWLVSTPSPTTSYAFAPASYSSGLVVNRTWTLSGEHGDELSASLIMVNAVGAAISGSYDEVIPKSVAGLDSAITFVPAPTKVISADPVLRYNFSLAAGASVALSYSVDVGSGTGSERARLQRLAADQKQAQVAYLQSSGQLAPATLVQVSIEPTTLSLQVGQSTTPTLTGLMSDGTPASPAVLNGVRWSSLDRNVAAVDGAVITATGTGQTTVTAQAGDLTASLAVFVSALSSSVDATTVASSPGTSNGLSRSNSSTRSSGASTPRSSAVPTSPNSPTSPTGAGSTSPSNTDSTSPSNTDSTSPSNTDSTSPSNTGSTPATTP